MRRGLWPALLLGTAVLLGPAASASADPAEPTTYRSEVTALDPPTESVTVAVTGGDSFLSVAAKPGTEVEIRGYQGEPYLRIEADGEVLANRNAPSFWLNEDRYGRSGVPPSATVDARPDWRRVGSGGSHGWHDHRIHWMSPEPPPAVDPGEPSLVQEWSVPITVDGQDVTVRGTLEWVPQVSPLPWVAVGAIAVAGLILVGGAAGWGLVAGAVLASVVGIAQLAGSPLGPGAEVMAWLPPVLALAVAAAALVVTAIRSQLRIVAAALLAVWAGLRISTLWMPVLITPLPGPVERGIVALAAAAALAGLVGAYRRAGAPAP